MWDVVRTQSPHSSYNKGLQKAFWMSITEQYLDCTLFGKREIRTFNPGPWRIQIETLKYL